MDDDGFVIIDDIGNITQIETVPLTLPPSQPKQRLHELVTLYSDDCLEVMRQIADNCIDSIITDPPYDLGFMGKDWDKSGIAFQVSLWTEVLRILKPGGHILVMGGTRTYHRMVCAIEDAGFEIRDTLMWLYGQGMPKSHNGLKPAHEPICLARKQLSEKTVAENVLVWGTGALNIDGCRVLVDKATGELDTTQGRWPANVAHDGSDEVVEIFPESRDGIAVQRNGGGQKIGGNGIYGGSKGLTRPDQGYGGSGSAARFLYCAKASKADRAGSKHPTVKPIKLMQWLCRLITPPNGCVLDPFAGSGTTGAAAVNEGFQIILCESDAEYQDDIRRRFMS